MKTLTVSIRLTPEQIEKLKRLAAEDRRTLANLLNLLVEKGLKSFEDEKTQPLIRRIV